jgi:hypothetical protein
MAKAKDLAKIAALGALGYMLSRGKGDSSKTDTGDQKTSSYTKDTKKVEFKDGDEGYKNNVLKAITQKREGSNDQAGNQGVLGGDKPVSKSTSKPASKAAPKLETITTRKDPREVEAGMSRGTRTTPKDPREAEAGMSRGTRTTSMAGAGRGFVNPPVPKPADPRSAEAGMSRGTRTTSMAGAGRGFVNPPVPKPADPRSAETGMSRGTRNVSPGPGQADIDKIRRIQETFRVPSSMAGRPGYDEAGNRMKHGGAVKMASGGMTASRRADGIATKGKTRGKIC